MPLGAEFAREGVHTQLRGTTAENGPGLLGSG